MFIELFSLCSQVNLHTLQCLPTILRCLANQSGALITPLVGALTSNLASKNTNILSAAVEAVDELIKNIGNDFPKSKTQLAARACC